MVLSKSLEYRFAAELSLISGIFILSASILYFRHIAFFPDMGWMMGSQLLGHAFITNVVGIVSGIMAIIAGIMIYVHPIHIRKWGVVAWVFASISFFGTGGFFIGGILGIIAGFLAVTKGITFFGLKHRDEKQHGTKKSHEKL